MNAVLVRATRGVDWICDGYRPEPRAMAVLRICFALYVLVWPRDIMWIGDMSAVAFDPPPGPFALLSGPPTSGVLLTLTIFRAVVAMWVLIGWNTRVASAVLSLVLVACSGLAYSYGKVDHLILYDLAPLMLGLAGWGSAWSLDALRRKAAPVSGYAIFIYATMVAFGLWLAAAAKATSGWLDPAREATRYFVAADVEYAVTKTGAVASWLLQFDNALIWKFFDYATIFAEGWLVIAVFFPGLFRIGLIVMGLFHVGVWLLLHIDFHLYAFVYIAFFLKPVSDWFPEVSLLGSAMARRAGRLEPPSPFSESVT